jgi:hypothetical protein
MVKIVGIAVVRTGSDLNEALPLTVATDLSSFGFFQRQVGFVQCYYYDLLCSTRSLPLNVFNRT